jgi:hypothetical protein
MTLAERLRSWAQNEEMINQYYTDHGKDCIEAADMLEASGEYLSQHRDNKQS